MTALMRGWSRGTTVLALRPQRLLLAEGRSGSFSYR